MWIIIDECRAGSDKKEEKKDKKDEKIVSERHKVI